LTHKVPKPLVPVLDMPVVGHIIGYLSARGVADLIINVHYFAADVERFIGDGSAWNVHMDYLREAQLTGSAGAVKAVADRFRETFVVIGCDDVTDIDLQAALAFHRKRGAEATIVLAHAEDVSQYGAVIVDAQGRITEFQEKPAKGAERSHLVNTGVYIFEPSVLARIPAATFYDFGREVFPSMLSSKAGFYGMAQDAYWCDIGTPSEYRRVHFDALAGKIQLRTQAGATRRGDVLFGPGAHIDESAQISGPSCIGAGARIGVGAVVERSILWRGVVVGPGACVRDAVIGADAIVEAGSVVEGGEYAQGAHISTECTGRPV
jgi:NDP-sugar pyrophosphorylase family protein